MRKNAHNLQVAENAPKIGLDLLSDSSVRLLTMKRKPRKAGEMAPGEKKLSLIASPRDQQIVEATQKKYNLRSASEALRMALQALADREKLDLAS